MTAFPTAGTTRQPFALPGLLLGLGLGGFVDGIVFHQILQWHHLLSNAQDHSTSTLVGLETNVFWDGLFHAATWFLTLFGVVSLWRSAKGRETRRSGRQLAGWVLVGWGMFNLVEGVVNHHLLQIHHVRSGPNELAYDLVFLAAGILLVAAGRLLARRR
jgi:uncharacterized membrane protein